MNIFDAGIIGLLYEIGPYIAIGLAGIVILVRPEQYAKAS